MLLLLLLLDRRDVDAKDVIIEIKFAGIYHSDIYTARGEWSETNYPIVTGHEIAAFVTEAGSDGKKYKVDDRAGVGYMVDSYRNCLQCIKGYEQYCLNGSIYT